MVLHFSRLVVTFIELCSISYFLRSLTPTCVNLTKMFQRTIIRRSSGVGYYHAFPISRSRPLLYFTCETWLVSLHNPGSQWIYDKTLVTLSTSLLDVSYSSVVIFKMPRTDQIRHLIPQLGRHRWRHRWCILKLHCIFKFLYTANVPTQLIMGLPKMYTLYSTQQKK